MFEIKGKVALITGSANGIGFSIAKQLLKNGLRGVSVVDIDVANGEKAVSQLQAEYGKNSAIFIKTDITKETEFEEAFNTTIKEFKQLDIVINNAGIMQEIQWRKCVAVNLVGVITGSKLAMEEYLPKFKIGDEGILVNIASGLGIQPIEQVPIYVATKHGIVGFSRSIGGPIHYEKYKVRVITICPGITDTTLPILSHEQQVEPFRGTMNSFAQTVKMQSREDVAMHVVEKIQAAPFGSVWIIEKGVCTEAEFLTIQE